MSKGEGAGGGGGLGWGGGGARPPTHGAPLCVCRLHIGGVLLACAMPCICCICMGGSLLLRPPAGLQQPVCLITFAISANMLPAAIAKKAPARRGSGMGTPLVSDCTLCASAQGQLSFRTAQLPNLRPAPGLPCLVSASIAFFCPRLRVSTVVVLSLRP